MTDQTTVYFNKVYDDTYLTVLKYITLKCSNTNDINDILQDTYTSFYQTVLRKGTKYAKNPSALLVGIAKSEIYHHYSILQRKKAAGFNQWDSEITEQDEFVLTFDDLNLESQIVDEVMLQTLWQKISEKDEPTAQIFKLRYANSKSLDEISKYLNLPLHEVKNRLYRTIKELRRDLNI